MNSDKLYCDKSYEIDMQDSITLRMYSCESMIVVQVVFHDECHSGDVW